MANGLTGTNFLSMPLVEIRFRIALLSFAGIAASLALWILAAQLFRTDVRSLPTDPETAAVAKLRREGAALAASMGVIRGDLWAQSAFTYTDLYWANLDAPLKDTRSADAARRTIEKALDYAPHRTDVWLLLAALSSRFNWLHLDPTSALKMSFYTGPNEISFIPMRLLVATRASLLNDPELQHFVVRDIRLILLRLPKLRPAIQTAYRAANSTSRQIIETAVREVDPSFVDRLRSAPSG